MDATRTCVVCGEEYPAGGYGTHLRARGPDGRWETSPHRLALASRHRRYEQSRQSTPAAEARRARTEAIVAAVVGPPRRTLAEVGEMWGISRERVRQILLKKGLTVQDIPPLVPVRAIPWTRCRVCNGAYQQGTYRVHALAAGHLMYPGESQREARDLGIAAAYQHGVTVRQLAAKTGLSVPAIYLALRKAGADARGPTERIAYRNKEIETRLRLGEPHNSIAADLGVTRSVIDRVAHLMRIRDRREKP